MVLYISVTAVSFALLIVVVLRWGWRMMNWVWLQPKYLEKRLRELGFRGNSYKLLFGDMKQAVMMDEEAKSKPIHFSHDIVPRIMPFIHKTITDYGKNSFIWLGPSGAILLMDPELIREVLSKSNVFQKPPPTELTKLLAQGILSYETDKWAKHRRIINPAFHLDKLKHMVPSFHFTTCEMLNKWEKIVSAEGSEVDVMPYLQSLTSDAISRTAFGSSYEEGQQIFKLQQEQAKLILKATESSYLRFLPTKENRRMKHMYQEVRSIILRIINKRMNEIEAGEATNNDLLSILLESNLKEIQQNGNKKSGMSIDEIVEECKLFYFAGQETTSALLTWSMILLSKHSDWQTRAREEVLQVFGNNTPDYDKLNQLKLVTMIIQEVLRLYPPLILMGREVHKETKLGNIVLPSGVQLLLPTVLLHHDQEIWGEDVKEFNPERFSEGVNKATKEGKFAYFPFSWGPRICIGQNFAMLEAKMALAMILKHYAFEVSPTYAHVPYSLPTLQPRYGAHLILHKL